MRIELEEGHTRRRFRFGYGVTVPAVFVLAVYLFLVLAANSGVGTRLVVQITDAALPGSLSVEDLAVHPALNRVQGRNVILRDAEGREVIFADMLRCEIRLTALLFQRVEFERCLAANGRVLVQNQRDGRVGIAAAFTKLDRNKSPRFGQTALHFNHVDLYNVDVLVNLEDLSLLFRDTHASGASISVADDGFDMSAERIVSQGGRILLSERLLGFGPGPSTPDTLRWEVARMRDPWKTIATPYPPPAEHSRGVLDLPLHTFDVQGIEWLREDVKIRGGALHAGDIRALLRGWIQFLPETPSVAKKEQGVVSFDGLAKISFTADSPFLDFILPNTIRTAIGARAEETVEPLVLQSYGNIRFAEGAVHLGVRDVEVLGWSLEQFDGDISLHEGELVLHPGASARMWDGVITGDARFEPNTGLWDARACLDRIDFEAFARPLRILIAGEPPDWMRARVSTSPSRCAAGAAGLVLHGDLTSKAGFQRAPARMLPPDRPVQDPMLVADHAAIAIEWRDGIEHTPLRRATIETAGTLDQRGVFHIAPAKGLLLQGAGARMMAHGSFDTMTSNLDKVKADIQLSQLAPWLEAAGVATPPKKATATASIQFAGDLNAPRAARAELGIVIPAGDDVFPEMRTRVVVREDGDDHRIEQFSLQSPVGELAVAGTVGLFHGGSLLRPLAVPTFDLKMQGERIDVGLLSLDGDIDGRLVHGDFHLRGDTQAPRLDGEFLFDAVRVAGESFDIVQGHLSMSGPRVAVSDLEVVRGKGRIRGSGDYNLRTGAVQLQAEGRRMRLREFGFLRADQNVDGMLRFDIQAEGHTNDLTLNGSTIIDDLKIAGRTIGSTVFAWNTSDGIIRGTGIVGRDLDLDIQTTTALRNAHIEGWFRHFPLTEYFPELRDAFGGSYVTGQLKADIDLRKGSELALDEVRMITELDDLLLRVGDRSLRLRTSDCDDDNPLRCPRPRFDLFVKSTPTGMKPRVDISNLGIGAEGHYVDIEGMLSTETVGIRAAGDLDLTLLRLLPDLIVDAEGIARLELEAVGPTEDPDISGEIRIRNALIAPRGLGTTLTIDNVVMLVDGETITIPADRDRRLVGTLFNGDLGVSGAIGLKGFIPDSFDLNAAVTGLAYRIPNELNITLNADLQVAAGQISDSTSWSIAGDVELVDGRYYRDINILSDAFNIGGFGRSVEVFSQPIWQTNPIVRDMQAKLNITGRDRLRVVSTIANAELNLELKTDLRVTGPIGKMHVTGEMTLLDNSRVYYGDRRFEVADGALLFDGFLDEQGFPWPFMDARLETEFKSSCASRRRGTLDATQTSSNLVRTIETNPTIYMQVEVQGRLPLDMTFNLESRPFYDQRDQLSLIVTGCSVDELTSGSGSAPTLELVFRPVIQIVEQSVEERFNIDDVDLIPTPGGNADILVEDEVSERLTWTLDATVGAGDATRQTLSGRLTIRNGIQLELLQQSNTLTPFSLNGGLRFRWRLE